MKGIIMKEKAKRTAVAYAKIIIFVDAEIERLLESQSTPQL